MSLRAGTTDGKKNLVQNCNIWIVKVFLCVFSILAKIGLYVRELQDAITKLKSNSYSSTPSQFISHRGLYWFVNPKNKLRLRHPLSTFCSFSYLFLDNPRSKQRTSKTNQNLKKWTQMSDYSSILIPRKPHFNLG